MRIILIYHVLFCQTENNAFESDSELSSLLLNESFDANSDVATGWTGVDLQNEFVEPHDIYEEYDDCPITSEMFDDFTKISNIDFDKYNECAG